MDGRKLNILIVNNKTSDRELYKGIINTDETSEFIITEAETGEEGLKYIHSQPVDCILLNYDLPDMNGLELIDSISQGKQRDEISFILLTEKDDESIAARAMKMGVSDYYAKGALSDEMLIRNIHSSVARCSAKRIQMEQKLIEVLIKTISNPIDFLVNILESLTHPFYVIDVNTYMVVIANRAALDSISSGEMTCYRLTHRRDEPCNTSDHPCPLQEVVKNKKQMMVEHLHYDKNGDPRHVEVYGYPIFDDSGNVIQMIEYTLDITERKHAEEELKISEKKLRERNLRMEKDLRVAQITQDALFQKDIPQSDYLEIDYRYLPLEKVGGDYFSITPVGEGGLGVFIGDVAGHGVSSALFLALIKVTTERVFRDYSGKPEKYIESLNRELVGSMPSYFITCIYGLFELVDGLDGMQYTFSNGAHPKPVLLRADGSCEYISGNGTVIGAFEEAKYDKTIIKLSRGDRVFLYTDGIPETINEKGEIIGFDEGLLEIFKKSARDTISETLSAVIEEKNTFRGSRPLDDDIIIIGFKVL